MPYPIIEARIDFDHLDVHTQLATLKKELEKAGELRQEQLATPNQLKAQKLLERVRQAILILNSPEDLLNQKEIVGNVIEEARQFLGI